MSEAHILWQADFKDRLIHPPAVSQEGNLYCPCNDGHMHALDQNGKTVWSYPWDPKPSGFSRSNEVAVTSTGRIVLSGLTHSPKANRYDELTRQIVLSPTGKLEWEMSFKGDGFCSQAEQSDGTILFTAPGKQLYAFDTTGRTKWTFKAEAKLVTPPCVGLDDTIYISASNGKVYALTPDGNKKWEFKARPPQVSNLAIGSGGIVCCGTYAGELLVIDTQGTQRLSTTLVAGESSHVGQPVILADGTIVMSSYNAIHAVRPDGVKKWSYSFATHVYSTSPCDPSNRIITRDGCVLFAPNSNLTTSVTPRPQPIVSIDSTGQIAWQIEIVATVISSLTLTLEGTLYVATPQAIHAIQVPTGLADTPWPMSGQNLQRTNRINPKFNQPIHYGGVEQPASTPIEIRNAVPRMPMPDKPFTSSDVLQQLDADQDFPALDNGYINLATVRMSAFRDALRWALVIEIVGWNNRSSSHEAIQNALYCYGNWLNQKHGLADNGFNNPTRDGDESSTFDDQDVDMEARSLYIRDVQVKIPRARKHYTSCGIKLEEPGVIKGYELLRALAAQHRDLLLATDKELRHRVTDLPLVLRLDEWSHPDLSADERPGQCETFQMIANVLASGDPSQYQPRAKSNTHWKHWPMAGQL